MTEIDPMVISIFSDDESVGGAMMGIGGTTSFANQALTAANDILYIPFRVARAFTVRAVGVHNGSTISGNIDAGIYSENGTKLWSSGSTAQAGASVVQLFTPTPFTLPSGRYYMAMVANGTTGTFRIISASEAWRSAGVLTGSAFPLPSDMSAAAAISGSIRTAIMFISQRAAS